MRSYKIIRTSGRKYYTIGLSDNVVYYARSMVESTYIVVDNELRTIGEGEYQYLDGRYILCSEDFIPYIYE